MNNPTRGRILSLLLIFGGMLSAHSSVITYKLTGTWELTSGTDASGFDGATFELTFDLDRDAGYSIYNSQFDYTQYDALRSSLLLTGTTSSDGLHTATGSPLLAFRTNWEGSETWVELFADFSGSIDNYMWSPGLVFAPGFVAGGGGSPVLPPTAFGGDEVAALANSDLVIEDPLMPPDSAIYRTIEWTATAVPEPSAVLLLLCGPAPAAMRRRRERRPGLS